MRRNPAKPAQPAEVRCQPALAFVSGVESPPNRLPVTPLAARITFTTTIIILFPGLEFLATPRRPAQRLPMPSPLLLLFRAAVLLRLRKLNLRRGLQPEVAPKWARRVVQDWAHACNTKHIDDLLELYAADATLIRSSVPPIRSLPAIREFLISLLEAGLGDVEMESLRVEMMGDIALDLGRCKMLVPVAMGKRREERGKYLVVLVRQPAGTWKILADCWSVDLAVSAPPLPESAVRKGSEPILPRKPR